MSYTTLEKKIHSIPEEYIEEVSDYIEFIIEKKKTKSITHINQKIFHQCLA